MENLGTPGTEQGQHQQQTVKCSWIIRVFSIPCDQGIQLFVEGLGRSFHQRGTVNVNVWKSDFVFLCGACAHFRCVSGFADIVRDKRAL